MHDLVPVGDSSDVQTKNKRGVHISVLGGKGGGGRRDFAQAGGDKLDKIEESYKKIKEIIN